MYMYGYKYICRRTKKYACICMINMLILYTIVHHPDTHFSFMSQSQKRQQWLGKTRKQSNIFITDIIRVSYIACLPLRRYAIYYIEWVHAMIRHCMRIPCAPLVHATLYSDRCIRTGFVYNQLTRLNNKNYKT